MADDKNSNSEIFLSFQKKIQTQIIKQRFRIPHRSQTALNTIPYKKEIKIGCMVKIVQKQDQRTGKVTEGTVKKILTSSNFHPHGIKVELENGKVGRVQNILN